VIDVRNPTNCVRVGFVPGSYHDVDVVGTYAYVADDDAGLQVIDVSVPANPVRLWSDTGGSAWGVQVTDSYAYVADGPSGLRVIDVSDPTNPVRVGSHDTDGWAHSVTVHGDKIFVAGVADGLIILNKFTSLRFGPAIVADDGRLRLRLSGVSGQRVHVQRSANLLDWEDWQTVTLSFGSGAIELYDNPAAASRRFYRAVVMNPNP
jgi:hypothetical protein